MASTTTLLKSYPDEYLECRRLKHAFKTIGFCQMSDGVRKSILKCMRCDTIGVDRCTAQGHRIKHRLYEWPDDYYLGQVGLPDIRKESMRRVTIYRNEDALRAQLLNGKKKK